MDWQKPAYIVGIITLSLVLLFKWTEFKDNRELLASEDTPIVSTDSPLSTDDIVTNTINESTSIPANTDIPTEVNSASSVSSVPVQASNIESQNKSQFVNVKTELLDIKIDLLGGDIIAATLPKFKVKLGGDKGFPILTGSQDKIYISQSGLVGANGTDTAKGRPLFSSSENNYTLGPDQESLYVDLKLNKDGIDIVKRFAFTNENYEILVSYIVKNNTDEVWKANFYGQIKRDDHQPQAAADSGFGVNPFLGAATTRIDKKYQKFKLDDFSDLNEEDKSFSLQGGWIAMVQHYFTSAWVGNKDDTNKYFLKKLKNQTIYLMGYVGPETIIEPGSQSSIQSLFYVGPKDIDHLEEIAPNLDLVIDFGFLWWIAKPLFHLLDFLHDYIGNWGWSIIVLTIIIKAIFFYPSAISYRSMAKMRLVSPKMKEIKERCGDDKQKLSQEMMKLYKKEKVNPMGGCLPILIQMPVFISLYWMLMESVELRHAPFILWIQDLSVMDPYFILPLLMGATMFIQQKLNPTPPDPMQAKIMQWMPVAFTFMFLWFPAGLVLYWVTNNTLSIVQQYIITRSIEKNAS